MPSCDPTVLVAAMPCCYTEFSRDQSDAVLTAVLDEIYEAPPIPPMNFRVTDDGGVRMTDDGNVRIVIP